MSDTPLKKILEQRVTRKEFLTMAGLAVVGLTGATGVIKELMSHAATASTAAESESGSVSSPATVITDTTASGGKAIKFGSGSTVTLPVFGKRLLGVYNSDGGDTQAKTLFGQYPDIASTYYQYNQVSNIVSAETARINRGTSPLITITTRGTTYIAGIASGDATALAWLDSYVTALNTLSKVNTNVKVFATLDHEWEVKVNQGSLTGDSADPTIYGKALTVFYNKCKANAPNVIYTYWNAGSDTAKMGSVMTQLISGGTPPLVISTDPYINGSGSGTATSNWNGHLNLFRSGTLKSQYTSLSALAGQGSSYKIPLAISEHGIETDTHTATAVAAYYTTLRQQMADGDIIFSIFFNSDNTKPHMITSGGSNPVPAAVTNFKACFAEPSV